MPTRYQPALRPAFPPVDSSRGVGGWLAGASARGQVVRLCFPVILAMGFLCLGPPANADFISSSSASGVGTTGTNLSAAATFEISGNTLTVTLSNTGDATRYQADILTALFFDIEGAPSLDLDDMDNATALLPAGHGAVQWVGDHKTGSEQPYTWSGSPANDVSGEWAFKDGLSGAPGGANYGFSSAGLDLFGPHDLFSDQSLYSKKAPDGSPFGIASVDGLAPTSSSLGDRPYIKSVVVFTLTVADTIETLHISNVSFQYGTDLSETNITPSPTGVVGLASLGLMGGICCLFRRLRRSVKRSWS